MSAPGEATTFVLLEVADERRRQYSKHGDQAHVLNGTGGAGMRMLAAIARDECQAAFAVGLGTWRHILEGEVAEALAEGDPVLLRAELVQVAAVAVQWVESIDEQSAGRTGQVAP